MQSFLEYLAVIAFVVVYFVTRDVFLATAVLVAGVIVHVGVYKLMGKPISNELKITFWISLVMGGLTLVLRDETFIQWKPTIVSWIIALVLVGARLITGTLLLKKVMGHAMKLPDQIWARLTYGWAMGFAVSGAANLYVMYNYSMDTWVTFKLVGLMGLNLFYVIAMVVYLMRGGFLNEDTLTKQDAAAEASNESQP